MEQTRAVSVASAVGSMLVNIEEVLPGMVLAEPARDEDGRLLVGRGVTVSRRLRRQLRLWGVAVVAVESNGVASPFEHDQHDTSAASDLIAREHADPFMQELARLTEIRHERRRLDAARDREGGRA